MSQTEATTGTATTGRLITAKVLNDTISNKISGKQDVLTETGSATQGIYVDNNGVLQAMTYTLGKSVPSDAKFTDTTYSSKSAASGGTATSLVTTGEKYTWNSKSTVTVQTVSSITSGVTTSEQKIYVDGTPYGVNGSIYMQQSKTVSTSADTSYTFTSSLITADSDISISTTDGISYKSVSSSAGTCTVVIGPQASATSVAVRIYIR